MEIERSGERPQYFFMRCARTERRPSKREYQCPYGKLVEVEWMDYIDEKGVNHASFHIVDDWGGSITYEEATLLLNQRPNIIGATQSSTLCMFHANDLVPPPASLRLRRIRFMEDFD